MKKISFIFIVFCLLMSCTEDNTLSPDVADVTLLPNREDYLSKDYGTQEIAKEVAGVYDSDIGMVIYDEETRTKPIMYLTRGRKDIHIKPLKSGAVELTYTDFQTVMMPLKMSVKIKGLLEKKGNIIYIRGSNGKVRTKGDDMPIGTPLPESDDAEMLAEYNVQENKLNLFIDLMLPIAVKAMITGKKK